MYIVVFDALSLQPSVQLAILPIWCVIENVPCLFVVQIYSCLHFFTWDLLILLSAFRDWGSLSRRVSVLRAPAQMGRARGRA
jgi:hypothetical protein